MAENKKGLDNTPAYYGSKKNEGKGVAVRPASYTNRNVKGTGFQAAAAYDKKNKPELHV